MDQQSASWYVYILLCKDRSLYTGITTHLQRRLVEHNSSNKAARYTRARRPVKLVYAEVLDTRSLASQREYAIKGLCRARKLALIRAGDQSLLDGVINVRSQ